MPHAIVVNAINFNGPKTNSENSGEVFKVPCEGQGKQECTSVQVMMTLSWLESKK